MTFYEQELRKIVEERYPDATYVGRACYVRLSDMNRAKIQFVTGIVSNQYNALQMTASCIMELRKEVLQMIRSEAIKAFFFKSVLPVTVALILYCIFKSACVKNGELDYVWLWILCGLPFGLHRMCLWIVPGGGSLGGGIALFALNFIIGGVIGGFILAWRLIVAVWYVPLTVYRLIVG